MCCARLPSDPASARAARPTFRSCLGAFCRTEKLEAWPRRWKKKGQLRLKWSFVVTEAWLRRGRPTSNEDNKRFFGKSLEVCKREG